MSTWSSSKGKGDNVLIFTFFSYSRWLHSCLNKRTPHFASFFLLRAVGLKYFLLKQLLHLLDHGVQFWVWRKRKVLLKWLLARFLSMVLLWSTCFFSCFNDCGRGQKKAAKRSYFHAWRWRAFFSKLFQDWKNQAKKSTAKDRVNSLLCRAELNEVLNMIREEKAVINDKMKSLKKSND